MCPECTAGHLIPSAEAHRCVGTIHSIGHSAANPLENRILRSPFLFSSALCRVTILGVANQTNMHLAPSLFNITVWKVSSLTKSMMLNNFVIDFSPVYSTIFEIRTLTPNFADRWRCKRLSCVAHGNFTYPSAHFYDYSSCRSEIIGVTTDLSGHTVEQNNQIKKEKNLA
ncbi:hypothetical protein AVEN_171392-1 [Araneus ventricosus]|uniref:Uncharacterized protein n=1 Tax=Araneus ventricosus TaxID=182803 RepID=A0A4Y2FCR3_ARAVE|nr:hypothetical protein AVEN_171392-1 [Araneus ventricosus]